MESVFGSCYGLKRKSQQQFVVTLYVALICVYLWAPSVAPQIGAGSAADSLGLECDVWAEAETTHTFQPGQEPSELLGLTIS